MTNAGLLISAGDGVVELQRFLHSQGYITKLQETPDGYTGALLQCFGCHAGHPIPVSLSFCLLDHPAWQLVRHICMVSLLLRTRDWCTCLLRQ